MADSLALGELAEEFRLLNQFIRSQQGTELEGEAWGDGLEDKVHISKDLVREGAGGRG